MIEVYFDGASAGNPGPSGAGVFINFKDGTVEENSITLPPMSNHEAEYEAFIWALKRCTELGFTHVSFRTDSQLIDDAVEKQFVRNPLYKPYLEQALSLINQFDLFYLKWIPSKSNRNADRLARLAIPKQKRA
ncbi:reverse transcriptase-like protein [Alkalicoccobacillus plakortidis]|uniref:Reverse transcriptase-like protein n=1 Tax=Alkalicoccobacillus plakortidis TaxID=444060 RepID=A0ABT0XGU5_9BACI|nr:reverse transcriptase-like protein [Alkalicoccobacillus plakortidis]MCM2674427.1 reverse transcriptase-like protein [Alkalicoccobacillus plakortidis]